MNSHLDASRLSVAHANTLTHFFLHMVVRVRVCACMYLKLDAFIEGCSAGLQDVSKAAAEMLKSLSFMCMRGLGSRKWNLTSR